MKSFLLLSLLILTSCSNPQLPDFVKAQELCKVNGGLKSTYNILNHLSAYCFNGAKFVIDLDNNQKVIRKEDPRPGTDNQ